MNDFEKEKIRFLRKKGMGYKAIATLTGLSRDAVRGYCRRNNLTGNSTVVALNLEEKLKKNEICGYCEKPIKQKKKGRERRFCSDECRYKWWNANQDEKKKSKELIKEYTCVHCSRKFIVYGRTKRKYCSHDCYIKDRYWEDENGV